MDSKTQKKKSWWIPALVALPSMGIGIIWNMNSTVIPMLIGTTTTSATAIANVVMMASLTGIVMPYIAGIISDRTNTKMGKRKPWVILGTILAAIFLMLLGMSTKYIYMFIFATLLYGVVNFYQGPYFSLMPESVEPNQVGLVNGWGKSLLSLGGVIFFFFGVNLYNANHIYPFILVTALLLIPTLIAMFMIKEDTTRFQKPTKLSLDFLKNSAAMRVFMTAFFFYLGYGLIMPFLIPYFEKVVHFTSTQISLSLTGFTFIGLILSIFIGMLCDRMSKQIVLFIACAIYGISFVVGIFALNLPLLWVFTILSGIGFVILQVVFYSLIPDVAPEGKLGEYMGINNVFLCIPQIIGNQVGGNIISSGHENLLFPIAVAALIIACIIIGSGKLKFVNKTVQA